MIRPLLVILLFVGSVSFFSGCKPDKEDELPTPENTATEGPNLPAVPYSYVIPELPAYFNLGALPFFLSIPDNNQVTNEGATLGRVLFYDKHLSENNTLSCSSCHHQELGFADSTAKSVGHIGGHTRRNASHIVNQMYVSRQFWDMRAGSLEEQVLMPIQDAVEMGSDINELISELNDLSYYPPLFEAAFGDAEITSTRISFALSQFVRSIVSYQTKFDEAQSNDYANYTQLELDGKDVFFNNTTRCNQCHMTVNFFLNQPVSNALDLEYTDNGRGEITENVSDNGKFKVPNLRNVELTGPYMHDGRFNTLEEVVEHYNSGVKAHPNIDERLTVEGHDGGTPIMMYLTEYQKTALVAFMKTLTDQPMISDPKYSDPF